MPVHGIVVLTDDERGVGAQFIAPAMGTGTTSADAPTHFPCVQLDQVVVMPNPVHGIVVLTD
ncbi:MAG: hypothetical protein RBU37_10885, partial [Myxococcota bacterium]|nr:hypothetical protein [Myxococcota bacterium]